MKKTTLLTLLVLASACNTNTQPGIPNSDGTSTAPITSSTPSTGSNSTGTGSSGTKTPTPVTTPAPSSTSDAWTNQFMDLINNHRTSIGLNAFVLSDDMTKIATGHSVDMANGTVAFGHDGFSNRCSQEMNLLNGGNLCAENVAEGQDSPQSAFDAWMGSPGHRANIESPRLNHTGFGYAKASDGTYYWTQTFLEL